MRIADGVLPPEVANDPRVVCRKAGLTEFHARLLIAIERIADFYEQQLPVTARKAAGGHSHA